MATEALPAAHAKAISHDDEGKPRDDREPSYPSRPIRERNPVRGNSRRHGLSVVSDATQTFSGWSVDGRGCRAMPGPMHGLSALRGLRTRLSGSGYPVRQHSLGALRSRAPRAPAQLRDGNETLVGVNGQDAHRNGSPYPVGGSIAILHGGAPVAPCLSSCVSTGLNRVVPARSL